jgi:hypothetical protein
MKNQELIKNSAKCALKFLEEYSYTENMTCAYKAFKALAELTLKDLDAGASVEECRYDPFYIAQQMGENYVKETKEKTINNAKNYLKKLMEAIAGHNDTFKTTAYKNKFTVTPSVKYIEGGGNGNPNLYYIDYEELGFSKNTEKQENFNKDEKYSESIETQENIDNGNFPEECIDNDYSLKDHISYFVEHIKLPRITNWIYNYEFSGFRFGIEITAFLFLWTITIIIGIYVGYVFFYSSFSISDFKIISLYAFIAFLFKIKWDCISRRIIVISPPLTAPSKFIVTQLECIATDEIRERTGNPIRKIQLVSYWATCPICKNTLQRNVRIDINNGGKEFHHRLIGRCAESPTEHVYSFDRVTLIGKPLR